MKLQPVFQHTFMVSGVMCFGGCGNAIQGSIRRLLEKKFPGARIYISAEPHNLGRHQFTVEVQAERQVNFDKPHLIASLESEIKSLSGGTKFKVNEDLEKQEAPHVNWLNILVNLIAIASIIVLSVIFPPSLLLSIGLASICFSATLFTARDYIFNFIKSLRSRNVTAMQTTVSFGWLLALFHSVYHLSFVPLVTTFAMTFMNFLMPLILVTVINVMDEIKRQIANKSKKVLLKGIKSLFPEMQDEYSAIALATEEVTEIRELLANSVLTNIDDFVSAKELVLSRRDVLQKDMLIRVRAGESFPVDGIVVAGKTYIDKSIINGESAASTEIGGRVQSGCKNVWQDVIILADANPYNSTANQMLFKANTKIQDKTDSNSSISKSFYYFYFGLFAVGFVASLALALALGTFSFGWMLQTMVGVLFAICPCTIAIAHFLPKLLRDFAVNASGVVVNNEHANYSVDNFDVFVFDKTGTLTAESRVEAHDGIPQDLWGKIYQLESKLGRGHPIARAIEAYIAGSLPVGDDLPISDVDCRANGISAQVGNQKISIGNVSFLQSIGVANVLEQNTRDTYAYVAVDGKCIGNILIRHAIRPGILESLQKLKNSGKSLVMLTGDKQAAADDFNTRVNNIFAGNIYAEHTPDQKKERLLKIAAEYGAAKVCFIGDGLNDALCSKKLRSEGGVSMSITADDKAAFFTDISLNGSLDYLFEHQKIQEYERKIVMQNEWIMAAGALIFLVFLVSFPSLGIGFSPMIPMLVMFSTTLFTLFNSYRTQIATENALKPKPPSFLAKIMQSKLPLALIAAGSLALVAAVLITSITSLQFALPIFAFSGGLTAILSSSFLVVATAALAGAAVVTCSYLIQNKLDKKADDVRLSIIGDTPSTHILNA